MFNLYENIRKICHEHGTTPSRMCEEIGISKSTLSNLNKGRTETLSPNTARKIASYFCVSVDYLLGRTSDPIDYSNPDLLNDIPLDILHEWQGENMSDEEMARQWVAYQRAVEEDAMREKAPTLEGERAAELSPAFFRLKQGLEPYDISESDVDFLLEVYKAHIKKNP